MQQVCHYVANLVLGINRERLIANAVVHVSLILAVVGWQTRKHLVQQSSQAVIVQLSVVASAA